LSLKPHRSVIYEPFPPKNLELHLHFYPATGLRRARCNRVVFAVFPFARQPFLPPIFAYGNQWSYIFSVPRYRYLHHFLHSIFPATSEPQPVNKNHSFLHVLIYLRLALVVPLSKLYIVLCYYIPPFAFGSALSFCALLIYPGYG